MKIQLYITSATTKYPNDITDTHIPTTIKQECKKQKICYSDPILVTATRTTSKTTPDSKFSKNDASMKETMHKHHRRPIIKIRFSSWRKFALSK
jgi:hypothetical protein